MQVGRWCKKNQSKLYCISNENLPLGVLSTLKRRGLKSLPPSIVKRFFLYHSKKVVEGVFTINSDGARIFLQEGFLNVYKMPLGYNPDYFSYNDLHRSRIRSKLSLTLMTFAYFGRVVQEKGIHILIEALKLLKDFDWQFMMDHFDEYATDYSRIIHNLLRESGINDRVVYIDPSHKEMGQYMNAADVVVVPSVSTPQWKEQYGRVAAESMACGCRVVTSDSGSLPELLNGHGHIFPDGDVHALANILRNILEKKLTFQFSQTDVAEYALKNLSIFAQKEIMNICFGFKSIKPFQDDKS
jgi:glycosyltransferase involved in cell wall biosynthesis